MSGRKLAILALIFVVLGFAAYLPRRPSETQRGDTPVSGDELFANLDVNAIASVEINADGKTSTISKKDDTWIVGSLYDYPADRSKIVEQLRGLKFLKIGQTVRGGDKMLDEFGLGEDSDSIRFIDSAGTELAALRIGKARTPKKTGQPPSGPAGFGGMPDGRYISTDGSNVILIDDSLSTWVGSDDGWVKKQLLSVTGTDITTVTVSSNDTAYSLNFESGEAKLGDLAEDEKLDTGDAGRVRGALNYLSFDSIADPALSDENTGMGNPITYRAKEKSGIVYELKIGGTPADSDDKRYAQVAVSYGALPPPTREDAEALVPSQPEPAEGSGDDASETPTKPREELVQEELDRLLAEHQRKADESLKKVEELAGLGGWTYLLTKYSAESISMGREQLVEKIEEEEEEEAEAEAADGSSSDTGPAFTEGPVFTPAADAAEPGDQPAASSESDPVAPPPPALPPIPTDAE
jgi:hypothetical protein